MLLPFRRRAWTAGALLGLLALGAWIGFSVATESPPKEEQTPRKSGLVEQVDVRLAMIEAVVLDRRGRHVHGLPPSAFHLYEGKREVPIITFDEIRLEPTPEDRATVRPEASASPPEAEPPAADAPVASETASSRSPGPVSAGQLARARQKGERWFVLLFDGYFNPSALAISNARRAAKKWLRENLREGDKVAVYELLPNLSTLQGFTHRTDLLDEAIDEVKVMPGSFMGQEMIRQRLEQTRNLSRDVREQQLDNAGSFGSQLDRSERDNFYMGIAGLGEAIGALDGTKAVVLFSGGFPITRSWDTMATGGLTLRFKRMLEILDRYGVRFFTFDVGEDNTFTGAEQSANLSQMADSLGLSSTWLDSLQIGAQINAANSHQEILAVLGNETGGRFMRGRDYAKGLARVAEDLSHYYLVGYRPVDLVKAGRYVRLKLKVDGKGLKVITRKGRFAENQAAAAKATRKQTPAALAGPPFALECQPQVFPLPGDRSLLVLPIHLADLLPLAQPGSAASQLQRLELRLRTRALISDVVIEESERSLSIPLSTGLTQRLDSGLMLREAMVLSPAGYQIEVIVHAPGLKRMGRWMKTVSIRATDINSFSLTDLSLLPPASKAPLVFDVFAQHQPVRGNNPPGPLPDPLGDSAGRPPVSAGEPITKSAPLLVQVGVVKPPPRIDAGKSPLEMTWELVPTGGGDPIELPVTYRRLEFAPDGSWLDVVAQLDLSAAEPGAYELRLVAVRVVTGTRVERTVPLTLIP